MKEGFFILCGFGLLFAFEKGKKKEVFLIAMISLLIAALDPASARTPLPRRDIVFLVFGICLFRFLWRGLEERLRFSQVPDRLAGLPILLMTAALLALAFSGFQGALP